MPFYTAHELTDLAITRMVFHGVGGDGEPSFMREVPVSTHGAFFVERIKTGNNAVMLDWRERSNTRNSLERIITQTEYFNRESKRLARNFHRIHKNKLHAGLFMLFQLESRGKTSFAILKYDKQLVMRFAIKPDRRGRNRVSLTELENALVKNPEALQKSALIRLAPDRGELCVRDRSNRTDVTRYFQKFLGATRRYSDAEMTDRLVRVAREVAEECAEVIAPAIKKNMHQRIDDAIRVRGGTFDPENPEGFLGSVFGPFSDDSPLHDSIERSLTRHRIEGDAFALSASHIPKPRRRRITTVEGISVTFDAQYKDRVTTKPRNGRTIITIDSGGVSEDDHID